MQEDTKHGKKDCRRCSFSTSVGGETHIFCPYSICPYVKEDDPFKEKGTQQHNRKYEGRKVHKA